MAQRDATLNKVREICLALPDTKETMTWGKPHFRVGEKIFAGYEDGDGMRVLGFKLEAAHAKEIVKDGRFWPAPYVGHKGWVSMNLAGVKGVKDWEEVRRLVGESYRLIAPKKSLTKLGADGAAAPAPPSQPPASPRPAPGGGGRRDTGGSPRRRSPPRPRA